MIEEKISPKVKDALKTSGVNVDDIQASSPVDLSFEAEYLDGYMVLTQTQLALALYDKRLEEVRVFKGYMPKKKKKKKIEQMPVESDVKVAVWDRGKIEGLKIEHQVATNLLVATIGGESVQLCAFTNLYLGTMNHLVKVYEYLDHVEKNEEQEEDPELFCPICHTKYPDPKRKICPNCMSKRSIFTRSLKYFTKYKLALVVMFAGFGISAALGLIWP
ncbi:MAG: hypothetical protein J6T47_03050, partial [Lachnospiraceae bacterium]|nr:hypothetical protein [Lachnospiraceae bacterium]